MSSSPPVEIDDARLRPIQPAGRPARLARVGDNHLVCRLCGAVTGVDRAVGHGSVPGSPRPSGYRVDEADVTFWGVRPACQATVQPRGIA